MTGCVCVRVECAWRARGADLRELRRAQRHVATHQSRAGRATRRRLRRRSVAWIDASEHRVAAQCALLVGELLLETRLQCIDGGPTTAAMETRREKLKLNSDLARLGTELSVEHLW